ncbi:MAG: ATP-dependent DNA helicase RecG [Dehalococcoidales bacterium]|nr:ATP-dependent DNA helicase RecG [Dehalococcoidales bacterium]
MAIDVKPLRNILELERRRGYPNRAVIGGVDKFLHYWSAQAIESVINPRLQARFRRLKLINSHYASLTPSQREQWAGEVLGFLIELESPNSVKEISSQPPAVPKSTPTPKPLSAVTGSLDSPITVVKGISLNLAARFNKLGVSTIRDLLYFFPHRHLDYSQKKSISQLEEGEEETIIANIWQAREVRLGGRRSTEAIVGDETGNVRIVWFNNPYLVKRLTVNTRVVISGRVSQFNNRYVFESPEWELVSDEDLIHTGRLVPVYSLTRGLHPRQVRKLIKGVIDQWMGQVADFLPQEVKNRCHLLGLDEAIGQAHYPDDESLKAEARRRLAFDELFLLQLGVLDKKRHWQQSQPGRPFEVKSVVLDTFVGSLPFKLTSAQQQVLGELLADLQKSLPMSRLLQGEVGSGKTVLATASLLMAAANGYQGALMAPTEILAEQHFRTIRQLLSRIGQEKKDTDYLYSYTDILSRPFTVALLIGNVNLKRKQKLRQQLQDGGVALVIGTHALIQQGVEFHRLGLAVIDEQHRFGVVQRSALRQKGFNPHILAMTATPIPRTLALTLYGDLDLSVIDELPPGRQVIKTRWLKPEQRRSAYAFVRKQVAEGHQAFIICPLVEESAAIQAKAAVTEYEYLSREVFPDLKLGLLHGRMSSVEKDRVMRHFHAGELDILVSTSVVEVGIDVPNATVMMVESADRFGLSQLHQFRGRVGRGKDQSYCMLLAEKPSEIASQRLDIIERVQDGFQLAEEDLKLRGPGEFFGTRQSGLPDLRMAKLSDVAILELARREAIRLFEVDPTLEKPEHQLLTRELARVWPAGNSELS